MSAVVIVLIVLGVLIVLAFVGGLLAVRRRTQRQAEDYQRRIAEADQALEQARASDRGWDRPLMEAAAQAALGEGRPGWTYEEIVLVLVDDRPGVTEDRAHFLASGAEGEARVILVRRESGWVGEGLE
jgi:hypothetical protein